MSNNTVTFEKLPNTESYPEWLPKLPEHNGGGQHENAGMDFFSATRVVAEEVGSMGPYLPEYFEVEGSDLTIPIDYESVPSGALRMYQAVIPTGLRMKLPHGHHMRIASRSGLGFKQNIYAFPGTIDCAYRGPIMIKLIQFTTNSGPFVIEAGSKIAQGIIFQSQDYSIEEGEVSEEETSRGAKGFGSSG